MPLIPDLVRHLDIADADFNWFEAAQLLLAALVVPVLAKLGDMCGHKRILLVSTVLTAAASWWLVFADDFTSFLIAWALQGFYVVWLPLEVALIFDRGRRTGPGHRRPVGRPDFWSSPSRPARSWVRCSADGSSARSATAFPRP